MGSLRTVRSLKPQIKPNGQSSFPRAFVLPVSLAEFFLTSVGKQSQSLVLGFERRRKKTRTSRRSFSCRSPRVFLAGGNTSPLRQDDSEGENEDAWQVARS